MKRDAVAAAHRVDGVLAVDTFGAVGDGGAAGFDSAIRARTAPEAARRLAEIDAMEERGQATAEHAVEQLRLVWPAYFASGETAPPMPDVWLSGPGYLETMQSATQELPALELWVEVLPDAGHFPWIEAPGSVRAALARLVAGS